MRYGPQSQIGFLYSAGAYTAVSDPFKILFVPPGGIGPEDGILVADHADYTEPTAINDSGQIVGSAGVGPDFSGFFFSGGTYTNLGHLFTQLTGINNAGQVVGSESLPSLVGFLYSGGVFTDLHDPAATGATVPTDINNVGQIVGYYSDSTHAHGFIYNNGTYTTLDDPLGTDTYITGENDNGQIVGNYDDASGNAHGFLYANGTFTTIDNPSGETGLSGINNAGEIVGTYSDSADNPHGFIASTSPISLAPLVYSPDTASTIVYAAEYGTLPDPTETFNLINFTNPQYAYGQQVGVVDPVIYAYEALGAALASDASHFQNIYGPTAIASDSVFVTNAYTDVFGHPGTPAQVQHFADQLNFLEAVYTASGSFGSSTNVELIARGAVYGQMLGIEAEMTQVPIVGITAHVPLG
jgi:probable HAF family extracellular repeat protein